MLTFRKPKIVSFKEFLFSHITEEKKELLYKWNILSNMTVEDMLLCDRTELLEVEKRDMETIINMKKKLPNIWKESEWSMCSSAVGIITEEMFREVHNTARMCAYGHKE